MRTSTSWLLGSERSSRTSGTERDQGVVLGCVLQGRTGGIGPGQLTQKRLQISAAAEALQITDQGQGTIAGPAPAHGLAIGKPNRHQHRQGFTGKALDQPIALGAEPERIEGVAEAGDIPEHGWQDGEMGQGTNAH